MNILIFVLNLIYSLGGLGQIARFFENNTELLKSVK